MKLFITFGSWGEIAPLLEIALQLQEAGQSVEFCTTPDWSDRVEAYGVKCHKLPAIRAHEDSIEDFLAAHLTGKLKAIYQVIAAAKPKSIVAAFYCFPAFAYADKFDIPFVATTTTPYYFTVAEKECYSQAIQEYERFREQLGCPQRREVLMAALYPWYLHQDIGAIFCGYPVLRPLKESLSEALQKFIKQPYGVVTCGTTVGPHNLDRMVNAIKAHGLKCLYLGRHICNADFTAYLENHFEAVRYAKICITHAGIGTTVDCMGVPMVVSPVAYDQHYNAARLIDLCCAVPVNDSYIKAIGYAMNPRSYLPNYFKLDFFLHEHTKSNARRHAANVSECAQIH